MLLVFPQHLKIKEYFIDKLVIFAIFSLINLFNQAGFYRLWACIYFWHNTFQSFSRAQNICPGTKKCPYMKRNLGKPQAEE